MGVRVKFVTAYVPLLTMPHRSDAEYRRLGDQLQRMDLDVRAYVDFPLAQCWLYQHLITLPELPKAEAAGNLSKNTLAYHIVQHSKTQWLRMAYEEDPTADVYVWVDYGILKDPSAISESHLYRYAEVVNADSIAAPGYMLRDIPFGPGGPHWRFCGTMFACPAPYVVPFDVAVQETGKRLVAEHNVVSFEINTWAAVELQNILPIRQYHAVHDHSMIECYMECSTEYKD